MGKRILFYFLIISSISSVCYSQCVFNGLQSVYQDADIAIERETMSKRIASYLDTTMDPCEDFNQYACGNFFKVHKEEKHISSSSSLYDFVDNKITYELAKILSEKPTNESEDAADTKARKYFQSCMAEDIFSYGPSETYSELIESFGGWPTLDPDWRKKKFDWFETVVKMSSLDVSTIVYNERSQDESGTKVNIYFQYLLLESDDICDQEKNSPSYRIDEKLAMFLLKKYNFSDSEAREIFNDFIKVSKKLCFYHLEYDEEDYVFENDLINYPELLETINFKEYVNIFLNSSELFDNLDNRLIIRNEYLWEKINKYLKRYGKRTANALFLKFLYVLHDEYRSPRIKEIYCVQKVRQVMEPVLNYLYIRSQYHKESAEDEVLVMAAYIKNAMKSRIKTAKWLDKNTRKNALKKLKFLHINVDDSGYDSEHTLDIENLNRKYENLEFQSDSFHQNHLAARRFIASIFEDDKESYYSILTNAYYDSEKNSLTMQAGVFHKPSYIPELPKAYNFGSLGSVVGHEIGHGFDVGGIAYDFEGKENNWWQNETREIYDEKVECFVDQYNQYKIEGLNENINGTNKLAENLADHIGLRISYLGYKTWLKTNNIQNEILPGLNLTNWQLFFVGSAQTNCDWLNFKMTKYFKEDEHTVTKWRNIGMLVNFKEFAEAFQCKPGTPMNPEKKCEIW